MAYDKINWTEATPVNATNLAAMDDGIAAAARVEHYTATLAAASWTGSSAPFQQAVSLTGILSTDIVKVSVDLSGASTFEDEVEMEIEFKSLVYRVTSQTDQLTFFAKAEPSINLDIAVEVVR